MNNPWVKMPSEWIRQKRRVPLKWTDAGSPRSHKIAALRLYIAIALTSESRFWHIAEVDAPKTLKIYASAETYNSLIRMSGLSRALIAGGLSLLKETGIVNVLTDGRRSLYEIRDYDGRTG